MSEEQYKHTEVQLQESLKRLTVIYKVYKEITKELDMDVLVREILSLLRKHLEADGMAVFFVNRDNQELVLHSALGLPQELITTLAKGKDNQGVDERTIYARRPRFIKLSGISSGARKIALKHGFKYAGSCPLIASQKFIGTIIIVNKNNSPIQKKDQELLMIICNQLGIVLQTE